MIGNLDGVGENHASKGGLGTWGALRSADNFLSRWVDEEMNLGWPNNQHIKQSMKVSMKRYDGGTCRIQVPGMPL
ncbi:hypothetical protein ACHAWU_004396 [Discostella pseudostelligera]|uniref:LAGLIDADG homing endonuclease n=1 Tax=Discostella pseudostelligera TaxID=259834 RepID=A0ABD3N732_9STRA